MRSPAPRPVVVKDDGSPRVILEEIYERLLKRFGPQHWWPGQTRFEVIVGAILTQNTNWGNVEKALENLKKRKVLHPRALHALKPATLAGLIRPAGYFNVKAKRLKNFLSFFFREYHGSLRKMAGENKDILRKKLLSVNGIGPETADSILLYAFAKPSFVIDAYTKRILTRHNLCADDTDYHTLQNFFEKNLKKDVPTYNEFHALIVRLGKDFCRPNPKCAICPLNQTQYSLVYKCVTCHRGLLKKTERKKHVKGFVCRNCQSKIN